MSDFIKDSMQPKPAADDEAPEPEQRGSTLSPLGAGTDVDTQRTRDNSRPADPLGDFARGRR